MNEAKDKQEDKAEENKGKKTLSLGGTLSLGKGAALGSAPRSAAPGTVAVEVRRKRAPVAPAGRAPAPKDDALSSAEREARAEALKRAMADDGGKSKSALPKRRVTIEDKKKEQEEAKDVQQSAREKELEELRKIEQEEKAKIDELNANAPALPFDPDAPQPVRRVITKGDDESEESYRDKLKKASPKAPQKTDDNRRGGRITVTQALNRDYERDRSQSLAAQKRAREKARLAAQGPKVDAQKVFREVIVPEVITVAELANRMTEPTGEVVKALMGLGVMATVTQSIDADTAELVITEFGHKIKRVTDADVEDALDITDDAPEDLLPRAPVVTIMGHVDHGKTSLLDALRNTNVVSGEAGGITQHIGAYQVTVKSGAKITFLDTPGHSAFSEMRARGAHVTDIVVIVVSAVDSVMPQTVEAIRHAQAANVPIIIAVNKIDLPEADPMKVKTELLQYEVVVEELSGDVQAVEISAKHGTNLEGLVEAIALQAELLELKGNPKREAQGVVIESKLEKGRGPVATVLIQNGHLKVGDIFVAGAEYGKVRALINDKGESVTEASLGQPVEVLGANGVAESGDVFSVLNDEAKVREIASYRQRKKRELQSTKAMAGRTTIDDLLLARETGEKTSLPVIVKGDVHGSVEAILGSFEKMVEENDDIVIQVLHQGVGGITETDVKLARASNGIIIGFNVRANAQARDLASKEGVDIRYYNVIYDVIDDAKAVLTGMLAPTQREEYIGNAVIKEVFNITKVGKVAGCEVTVGVVKRGSGVRLLRDDVVIHEGRLKTLQRFKDEVPEVKEGTECGMAFENYDDIKAGDVIECFEIIEEARVVH